MGNMIAFLLVEGVVGGPVLVQIGGHIPGEDSELGVEGHILGLSAFVGIGEVFANPVAAAFQLAVEFFPIELPAVFFAGQNGLGYGVGPAPLNGNVFASVPLFQPPAIPGFQCAEVFRCAHFLTNQSQPVFVFGGDLQDPAGNIPLLVFGTQEDIVVIAAVYGILAFFLPVGEQQSCCCHNRNSQCGDDGSGNQNLSDEAHSPAGGSIFSLMVLYFFHSQLLDSTLGGCGVWF